LERKDRQILIVVHSSGGSRPSDNGGGGPNERHKMPRLGARARRVLGVGRVAPPGKKVF